MYQTTIFKDFKTLSQFAHCGTDRLTTLSLDHSTQLACLHDQNKSGFFGGPAFSSQSELFDNFSDCFDWPDKSRASKKPLLF